MKFDLTQLTQTLKSIPDDILLRDYFKIVELTENAINPTDFYIGVFLRERYRKELIYRGMNPEPTKLL